MQLEKVIDGIAKYVENHIVPQMNNLQQVGYFTFYEMVKSDTDIIKQFLSGNFFARLLISADKNGDINMERVVSALKKVISKKGKISFSIPMYGDFNLTNEDISEILKNIQENNYETNSQNN
jgi:hypothetical protein